MPCLDVTIPGGAFCVQRQHKEMQQTMSHFAEIHTQIRDIAALQAACAELGLQMLENTEARGYNTNRIHGDYVVRLKGPFDVALQRQLDGGFLMIADLWQGHVEKELGSNFGRLKQLYGVHKTMLEARKRGLTVRRHQLSGGAVRLALCRV
jgi:hypothetical protein